MGVVVGVAAVAISGVEIIDPIIALLVAANIVATGISLLRRSTGGLMDRALDEDERASVEAVLERFAGDDVRFHALRTRRAGRRAFISVHVLVPGYWSVKRGHDLVERVEEALRSPLDPATVFTHLEPLDDPSAFADIELDRRE